MLQVILRSTIIYLVLLAGFRLLGKRQLGELELNELVIAMLVSDFASTPLQDLNMPLYYGIASALTLLLLSLLFSFISLKSLRFRTAFYGTPTVIIENGRLIQSAMRRNRFTVDELLGELRVQGIMDLRSVKYAILETNGQLSILPAAEQQPLTAGDMGIETEDNAPPVLLINDGRLLREALAAQGLDRGWLQKLLKQHGLSHHRQVFLLSVDSKKRAFLIPKGR
ncbi:MAG: DUF421 domain-containing protein [Oscillospiraceae bacterium]|nr:DUF421 domain-containing protein [Oscillospiraceae bacterium]